MIGYDIMYRFLLQMITFQTSYNELQKTKYSSQ